MSQSNNSNPVSPELAEQLQSTLDQTVKDLGIPGTTASVITPNGTWYGASGVSNLETQEPMQPDDIFSIASFTKTFTAATVLKTVESGKLSLDDTLGQWLPEVAERIPDGENITIRQLLNGTSGIYDFIEVPQYLEDFISDFQAGSTKDWQPEDIVAYIYDQPRFEGSRSTDQWNYPNTGNVLAGMIVEKATGKDFSDVLQEEVLDPLGLKDTFYGKEGLESIDRDRLASGYQDLFTADGQVGQDGIREDLTNYNVDAFQAAGAMYSNTQDIVSFFQALSNGELLKPESLQEMLNFVEVEAGFGYGLGVLSEKTIFGDRIGFGGDSEAYSTKVFNYADLDTTLVTGVNSEFNYEDPLKSSSFNTILQVSLLEASGIFSQFSLQGTSNDDNLTVNPENDSLAGLEGLEGNDTLTGKDSADVLNGGVGCDSLIGQGNIDYLFGKEGNDFLDGGEDSDRLNGGLDNDTLIGGNGDDIVLGSEGKDSLDGGAGNDYLDGGAGNDVVQDEQGNNSLYGNEGNDLIFAGINDDLLYGGAGNDSLSGDGGSDRLIADAGNDTLDAGEDDDTLFGGEGDDLLIGGGGKDTLTGNEGKDLFAIASQATITITDFTDGQDLLQLSEGLSFDDLTISQGKGENTADTLISLNSNNEPIAILSGVSADLVTSEDFYH
jgi:CubicO group peptidase (beta-lactamase class C family)